jgi:hypothetical protein
MTAASLRGSMRHGVPRLDWRATVIPIGPTARIESIADRRRVAAQFAVEKRGVVPR